HGGHAAASQYGLRRIRNINTIKDGPHSSVLLIDEIDKASRDFTNDLLNEIENNRFTIPEMEVEIVRSEDRRTRSLVIMTSNSEKTLPDAFLRRCLFYNVPFPSDSDLLSIILQRLGPFLQELGRDAHMDFSDHYRYAIDLFRTIRERS